MSRRTLTWRIRLRPTIGEPFRLAGDPVVPRAAPGVDAGEVRFGASHPKAHDAGDDVARPVGLVAWDDEGSTGVTARFPRERTRKKTMYGVVCENQTMILRYSLKNKHKGDSTATHPWQLSRPLAWAQIMLDLMMER